MNVLVTLLPSSCGRIPAGLVGPEPHVNFFPLSAGATQPDTVGGDAVKLEDKIRDVPDFPIKGVLFKDITTLLKDPDAYHSAIDAMVERFKTQNIDVVVGMESRGFVLAAPMAYLLGAGLVPVRKLGKLPAETVRAEYSLEYGTNTLEMHKDAIQPGQRVLVVDDLLATGGTTQATVKLVEQVGGKVVAIAFLIERTVLRGREKLKGYDIYAEIKY